jgi:uncharacterized protein YkwD
MAQTSRFMFKNVMFKLLIILLLIPLSLLGQADQKEAQEIILNDLNEARAHPYIYSWRHARKLLPIGYKKRPPFVLDERLNEVAYIRAKEQAHFGNLSHKIRLKHSGIKFREVRGECLGWKTRVIRADFDWVYNSTVASYIRDYGNHPTNGHRKALLGRGGYKKFKKIGIGVYYDEKTKTLYDAIVFQ